ncbi:uncharacterized protein LOC133147276 [Syngnathus typhle]|uniref:uncharacterized protein LOC133147276 n=1 Tax=Syngnathus typhle TaxID=161592 RepID=UPI002A6B3B4D|nr:uncharacterized protein LOC133147276 [Syngnathus typhle]
MDLMASMTSRSKHFMMMEAERSRFLRHRYNGGSLETRSADGLLQGNVKDVREDTRQLPSAVFQRQTWDVVRARRLTGVDSGERPLHAVGREAQGLLVWRGSGLQRASAVLSVEASKEAVDIVEQTDVALTASQRALVVRDGLNALPKAPCVLAVLEVGGNLARERPFRLLDAPRQVGPRCPQASLIPRSEDFVPGPQQPKDSPCQPWLPVSPSDDGFRVGHIINALRDVRGKRVSILLHVHIVLCPLCSIVFLYVSPKNALKKVCCMHTLFFPDKYTHTRNVECWNMMASTPLLSVDIVISRQEL